MVVSQNRETTEKNLKYYVPYSLITGTPKRNPATVGKPRYSCKRDPFLFSAQASRIGWSRDLEVLLERFPTEMISTGASGIGVIQGPSRADVEVLLVV